MYTWSSSSSRAHWTSFKDLWITCCLVKSDAFSQAVQDPWFLGPGFFCLSSNIHTYIYTSLYLPSDFRVAYAANISEHLTIRWEIDHHTGNYVPYSFRLVCGFFADCNWFPDTSWLVPVSDFKWRSHDGTQAVRLVVRTVFLAFLLRRKTFLIHELIKMVNFKLGNEMWRWINQGHLTEFIYKIFIFFRSLSVTQNFSLSHARVMLINSHFITELKIVALPLKYRSNWTESYIFVNHLSRPFI